MEDMHDCGTRILSRPSAARRHLLPGGETEGIIPPVSAQNTCK